MSDEPKWHVVEKLFSTHRPAGIPSWVLQHPPEGHKAVVVLISGLDYNCCFVESHFLVFILEGGPQKGESEMGFMLQGEDPCGRPQWVGTWMDY